MPDERNEYVHSQRPKSITTVIHHTIVAFLQINFQGGRKPCQGKEAGEQKGKVAQAQNASKVPTIAKKTKNQEKGYKGKARLSLEQMEQCHQNGIIIEIFVFKGNINFQN